jgi:hypothetical protein
LRATTQVPPLGYSSHRGFLSDRKSISLWSEGISEGRFK